LNSFGHLRHRLVFGQLHEEDDMDTNSSLELREEEEAGV
jgi:hypothetical protein